MNQIPKIKQNFLQVELSPHSLSLYVGLQTQAGMFMLILPAISSLTMDQLSLNYFLVVMAFLVWRSLCQPPLKNISYLVLCQAIIMYLRSLQENIHIHCITIIMAILQQLLTFTQHSLPLKALLWLCCVHHLMDLHSQEHLQVVLVSLVLFLAKKTFFIQQTAKLQNETASTIQAQTVENSPFPVLFLDSTYQIVDKNRQCITLDTAYYELYQSYPKDFRDLLCPQDVRRFHRLVQQSLKEKRATGYVHLLVRTSNDANQSQSMNESMKTNDSAEEKQKYYRKQVSVISLVYQRRLQYVVMLDGREGNFQIRQMQKNMNQSMITICNDLMESILQDFSKWNNLRSLKVIKESDLQALSQCISKLNTLRHFLSNNQEMSNVRQHRKVAMQKQCFHIKNAVIQCMELLSIQTMQIEGFMLNLKFEDSFPIYVVGDMDKFKHVIIQIIKHMQDYMQGQKHNASSNVSPSIKLFCKLKQYDNDTNNFRLTFEFHVKDNNKLYESLQEIVGSQLVEFNHIKPNFESLSLIGSVLLPHIVAWMDGSMHLEKTPESSHFQLILELPFKNENQMQCVSQPQTVSKTVSSATIQKQGIQQIFQNEVVKIKPNISPLSFCRLQLNPNNYNWKKKVSQEAEKKFTINKKEPAEMYGTLCKNRLNRFQLFKDSTPQGSDIHSAFKTASLNSVQEKVQEKQFGYNQSENLNNEKNKTNSKSNRERVHKITIISQDSKEEEKQIEKNLSGQEISQQHIDDDIQNTSEFHKPQKTKTFACNMQTSGQKTPSTNERLKMNTDTCLMNDSRQISISVAQTPHLNRKNSKNNFQPSPLNHLDNSTTKQYLQERNKKSKGDNKNVLAMPQNKIKLIHEIHHEGNDNETTQNILCTENQQKDDKLLLEFEQILKLFEYDKVFERNASLQQRQMSNYRLDLKSGLLSMAQGSQLLNLKIKYTQGQPYIHSLNSIGPSRSMKRFLNQQYSVDKVKELKRYVNPSNSQQQNEVTSRNQTDTHQSDFLQNFLNKDDPTIIIRRQKHIRQWNIQA